MCAACGRAAAGEHPSLPPFEPLLLTSWWSAKAPRFREGNVAVASRSRHWSDSHVGLLGVTPKDIVGEFVEQPAHLSRDHTHTDTNTDNSHRALPITPIRASIVTALQYSRVLPAPKRLSQHSQGSPLRKPPGMHRGRTYHIRREHICPYHTAVINYSWFVTALRTTFHFPSQPL